jgi:hypothetical protein
MRIGLDIEASYQIKCNNVRPDTNCYERPKRLFLILIL